MLRRHTLGRVHAQSLLRGHLDRQAMADPSCSELDSIATHSAIPHPKVGHGQQPHLVEPWLARYQQRFLVDGEGRSATAGCPAQVWRLTPFPEPTHLLFNTSETHPGSCVINHRITFAPYPPASRLQPSEVTRDP
jgi:hypothetical protein